MREQSYEFKNCTIFIPKWFYDDLNTFYFFGKIIIFLNFKPRLRHQGWCQNTSQSIPKLFGKKSFLTLQTFFKHVRNMSKKSSKNPSWCLKNPLWCLTNPLWCLKNPLWCLTNSSWCLKNQWWCLKIHDDA